VHPLRQFSFRLVERPLVDRRAARTLHGLFVPKDTTWAFAEFKGAGSAEIARLKGCFRWSGWGPSTILRTACGL
jgi:hypothetical protein